MIGSTDRLECLWDTYVGVCGTPIRVSVGHLLILIII